MSKAPTTETVSIPAIRAESFHAELRQFIIDCIRVDEALKETLEESCPGSSEYSVLRNAFADWARSRDRLSARVENLTFDHFIECIGECMG